MLNFRSINPTNLVIKLATYFCKTPEFSLDVRFMTVPIVYPTEKLTEFRPTCRLQSTRLVTGVVRFTVVEVSLFCSNGRKRVLSFKGQVVDWWGRMRTIIRSDHSLFSTIHLSKIETRNL